jgi:hypothetical protein
MAAFVLSLAGLRPKPVNDKTKMIIHALKAVSWFFPMGLTVLRRPGKRQGVVIRRSAIIFPIDPDPLRFRENDIEVTGLLRKTA